MEDNVIYALLLTLFAGLATGIGSVLAFFVKKDNAKFLSIALGFSAGVMIYISLVEIFYKGDDLLTKEFGPQLGKLYNVLAFFGGMILIGLIDRFTPQLESGHGHGDSSSEVTPELKKLYKTGIITALAIGIHNFPEGLATFFSALEDPQLGLAIAVAIAIHNVPEGIAVSVPIYYATGSKKKAFYYSFFSGVSEPVGAFIGYLFVAQFMSDVLMGIIFASIAGIMVFISFDQLLPSAREYGDHHLSLYGLVAGMFVMALSLVLFA